jgi:hypothetical protein
LGEASGRPALSAVCPPQAVVAANTASHANARLHELEGEGQRLMTRGATPGSFAPNEPTNNPAAEPLAVRCLRSRRLTARTLHPIWNARDAGDGD